MIGTVDSINYDGTRVREVVLRFPGRTARSGGSAMAIQTLELIGQGSFGTVYRAASPDYPSLALKISTGSATRLRRELDVLGLACTKGKLHLPRFEFGALNQAEDLVVIGMELCVPRTLHELILAKPLAQKAGMLFVAYQTALAVAFVHEEGCIHRDVKLQNFVFDLDGNVKLIDFGLSCDQMDPLPGDVVAGTVAFMAPEMAHNALYRDKRVSVGSPSDVWALGIVWFSIFTKRNPYHWVTTQPTLTTTAEKDSLLPARSGGGGLINPSGTSAHADDPQRQQNKQLLECVAAADWRWPEDCTISEDLKELVESVLRKNPADRPTLEMILEMPIWDCRRRSPPEDLMCFLGVQDDFLLAHDEAHLMLAVEQRSAGVSASLMHSRAQSPLKGGDGGRDFSQINGNASCLTSSPPSSSRKASLKVVSNEECDVDGVPFVQIYDVRASTSKKSKPIRDISVVIAEETAKMSRSRSRRNVKSCAGTEIAKPIATASLSRENSVNSHKRSLSKAALVSRVVEVNGSHSNKEETKMAEANAFSAVIKHISPLTERNVSDETHAKKVEAEGEFLLNHQQLERDPLSSLEESISLVCSSSSSKGCRSSDDIVVEVDKKSSNLSSLNNTKTPIKGTCEREGSELLVNEEADVQINGIYITSPRESERERPTSKRSRHDSLESKATMLLHDRTPPKEVPPSTSRSQSKKPSPVVEQTSSKKGGTINAKQPSTSRDRSSRSEEMPILLKRKRPSELIESKPHDPFLSDRRQSIPRAAAKKRSSLSNKPFLKPSPRLAAAMRREFDYHQHLASMLKVEHEWLIMSFRLTIEEDQARYNITWLAGEQAKSATHPHHFKELVEVTSKRYENGIVCDSCDYEFLPAGRRKKTLHFFHCSCGRDLCPACYASYLKAYTCRCCGIRHPNGPALRGHLSQRRSRHSPVTAQEGVDPPLSPPSPPLRGRSRKGPQPSPGGDPRSRNSRNPPRCDSPRPCTDEAGAIPQRGEAPPEGPWRPFAKLRATATPAPPSETREAILGGEWVRFFHLYPSEPGVEPYAFAYHIQPGRTGAVFLSGDFPIHSAVISMLERRLLVVEGVDVESGEDNARLTTLVAAKANPQIAGAFRALQAIEAFDINAMKQRRAPGPVAVYQAPRSAHSHHGDPFVYLRWFRFSEDRQLAAFLLSNGGVQVFVNGEFELRWFDEQQKFLVRSNGVCEVVGDRTFSLAPAINHLLYDAF
ncbi:unnamed protein product [Phytomonas sp. Hart1]|nr:unnamed protein product [Phytomonas sp. Hart1]|eukprot:CCW68917.1 unnamed protein product [Phytomonas sp. isolate Hart1]